MRFLLGTLHEYVKGAFNCIRLSCQAEFHARELIQ